ncbi:MULTISPECIES: TRAP transporter small permease [unclassified Pseudoxanthomonas]|uniref:TRAP transporter small permease n=1 Tax=unclassified Pseudoxanthomonas TaxID=2645906 RepID=UPI0030774445
MSKDTAITPSASGARRALDLLSNAVIGIAATALVGLVLVQGWQVIARYVLNDSPSWTEPVTLVLLSTAMGLAAASGVHTNRHFGFFLLAEALGPRSKRLVHAVSPSVVAVIGAVMAYWGWVLLLDGLDIRMAGAPIPQSLPYLPLSVGGLLMVVFALNRLVQALTESSAKGND